MAVFNIFVPDADDGLGMDSVEADFSYVRDDGLLAFTTATKEKLVSGIKGVETELVAAYPALSWISMIRQDSMVDEGDESDSVTDEDAMGDFDADLPADVVETS
jgi:hypothetical protein